MVRVRIRPPAPRAAPPGMGTERETVRPAAAPSGTCIVRAPGAGSGSGSGSGSGKGEGKGKGKGKGKG